MRLRDALFAFFCAAMVVACGDDDSGTTTADTISGDTVNVTPDTSTPDTSTPDTSTPDTSTPDTSTPDTSTPDTSTPDTSTPDTSADATTDVVEAGGNSCDEPATLTPDGEAWRGSGDLTDGLTDTLSAEPCGAGGADGDEVPEQVWHFEVPAGGGDFIVTVTPGGDEDLMVYAFDDDACTSCGPDDGWFLDDGFDGEPETLVLEALSGGESLKLVVDSFILSAAGSYTITVERLCLCEVDSCNVMDSCGTAMCECVAGKTCNTASNLCEGSANGDACDNPLALIPGADNTWSGTGDSQRTGLTDANQTTGCPNQGGFESSAPDTDEVWSFTSTLPGAYLVTATATDDSADFALHAYNDVACDEASASGSCFGYNDSTSGGAETLQLDDVAAAETIYIVVDAYEPGEGGSYDITVEKLCDTTCAADQCNVDDGCGGTCACDAGKICNTGNNTCEATLGDSCSLPFTLELDADPIQTGDLSADGFSDQTNAAACPSQPAPFTGEGVSDQFWLFTAPADGTNTYDITAVSGDGADVMVYAYPGASCGALDTCLAHTDALGTNSVNTIQIELAKDATAYIVVDAFAGSAAGPYTLSASLSAN